MFKYMVRVVLHSATWEDYEDLHEAMEARGFRRIIKGESGTYYQLPDAMYHIVSTAPIDQIIALAQTAIAESGKSGAVFVCEYTAASWSGLDPVE